MFFNVFSGFFQTFAMFLIGPPNVLCTTLEILIDGRSTIGQKGLSSWKYISNVYSDPKTLILEHRMKLILNVAKWTSLPVGIANKPEKINCIKNPCECNCNMFLIHIISMGVYVSASYECMYGLEDWRVRVQECDALSTKERVILSKVVFLRLFYTLDWITRNF